MIPGCVIERCNPADFERYKTMLERQASLYGRMLLKVSTDGGFASRDNLAFDKNRQVKDAIFEEDLRS